MSTRIDIRKPWKQRITAVVWAAILTAIGVLTIFALSGNTVDLELAIIAGFAALGAWLLFSALVTPRSQPTYAAFPATHVDDPDTDEEPTTPTR